MPEDLARRLRDQGLQPTAWANGPGERYAPHEHAYDKVIVVERGSITFELGTANDAVELGVGDRLDLTAGTSHDAIVGPQGVACLEAHLPAGSLDGSVRRPSGAW